MQVHMNTVKIDVAVLNKALSYMATKPYQEVAELIALIQSDINEHIRKDGLPPLPQPQQQGEQNANGN